MNVYVHLLHQAQPVEHNNVRNSYQKGDLFCVMLAGGEVHKYPLVHVFRICEFPGPTTREVIK